MSGCRFVAPVTPAKVPEGKVLLSSLNPCSPALVSCQVNRMLVEDTTVACKVDGAVGKVVPKK